MDMKMSGRGLFKYKIWYMKIKLHSSGSSTPDLAGWAQGVFSWGHWTKPRGQNWTASSMKGIYLEHKQSEWTFNNETEDFTSRTCAQLMFKKHWLKCLWTETSARMTTGRVHSYREVHPRRTFLPAGLEAVPPVPHSCGGERPQTWGGGHPRSCWCLKRDEYGVNMRL